MMTNLAIIMLVLLFDPEAFCVYFGPGYLAMMRLPRQNSQCIFDILTGKITPALAVWYR